MGRHSSTATKGAELRDALLLSVTTLDTSCRLALEQALRASRGASATWSAAGSALLLAVVACTCATPALLPWLALLLAAVGLPWRVLSFTRRGWGFFLIDYCYATSALVIVYLLRANTLNEENANRWLATAYSLSEGPLAAALILWECAWVPGSADHVITVLMHLLPGLVLFVGRHHHTLHINLEAGADATVTVSVWRPGHDVGLSWPGEALLWLLAAPTAFYVAWQLAYWLVVQVCCRELIQRHGYDTSYKSLTRRAGRANSYLYRLGRKGGLGWRLALFGGIQLVFTLATFAVAVATFYSTPLAVAWQVVKFAAPLHFGARWAAAQGAAPGARRAVRALAAQGLAHPAFLQVISPCGDLVGKKAAPRTAAVAPAVAAKAAAPAAPTPAAMTTSLAPRAAAAVAVAVPAAPSAAPAASALAALPQEAALSGAAVVGPVPVVRVGSGNGGGEARSQGGGTRKGGGGGSPGAGAPPKRAAAGGAGASSRMQGSGGSERGGGAGQAAQSKRSMARFRAA